MARIWGDVPLVVKSIDPIGASKLKREATTAIYAQIEADLTFAAANLPLMHAPVDLGRVTKGAAQGLLGKVYIYQKKFTNAKTVLDEVIAAKTFSLLPNIAETFSPTVKYHAEILFAVRYTKGIAGQDHGYWYANTQIIGLDSTLFKAYDAVDTRRPMIEFAKPTGNSNILPRKFIDIAVNNNTGTDFPVLRYADVLLLQVETLNEIGYSSTTTAGTAFAHLNAIRKRAGLAEFTATDLADQTAFRKEIFKQRRMD